MMRRMVSVSTWRNAIVTGLVMALSGSTLVPGVSAAVQDPIVIDTSAAAVGLAPVTLTEGHSSLLLFTEPIDRASVNNASVADLVVISPTQLLLQGKAAGSTSLVVWRGEDYQYFTLTVEVDLRQLEQALHQVFPDESIRVHSSSGIVVLSGKASHAKVKTQAHQISLKYAPRIINLIDVDQRPLQEVMDEIFPREDIHVFEAHNGVVLIGSVSSQEVKNQAGEIAFMWSETMVNVGGVTAHYDQATRSNAVEITVEDLQMAGTGTEDAELTYKEESFAGPVPDVFHGIVTNLLTVSFAAIAKHLAPDEKGVEVWEPGSGRIILAGKANHPANVSRLSAAAAVHGTTVAEIIEVPDTRQVLLEIKFIEADRDATDKFGIDFFVESDDIGIGNFAGGVITPAYSAGTLSSATMGLLQLKGNETYSIAFKNMREEGLLRVLSEPNLIAMHDEEASFLAGGEFPIIVSSGAGATTSDVEFREFGVQLNFRPYVQTDDSIILEVEPEVSILDFGPASVTLGGFDVPALITRRASSKIQMNPGQTLVLGGLLSQTDTMSESHVPFLSDIPVLGKLFTSESFLKEETELLVLVTPHLVSPDLVELRKRNDDSTLLGDLVEKAVEAPPFTHQFGDDIRELLGAPVEVPYEMDFDFSVDLDLTELEGIDPQTEVMSLEVVEEDDQYQEYEEAFTMPAIPEDPDSQEWSDAVEQAIEGP